MPVNLSSSSTDAHSLVDKTYADAKALASRQVATGTGLTGGGDLSADRTLALATVATNTILGNSTGGTATPTALSASAVRTITGQGWVVLSNQTLGANGNFTSVSWSGYSQLRVRIMGATARASTADTIDLTFNSDTSASYGVDTGSLGTALGLGTLSGSLTNTNRNSLIEAWFYLGPAGSWTVGYGTNVNITSTATVGVNPLQHGYVWTGSVGGAIATSLAVVSHTANNILAGSHLVVEGLA